MSNLFRSSLLAALALSAVPRSASAVTGFRWVAVQPTQDGAKVKMLFHSRGSSHEGHGHTIDLVFHTSTGKSFQVAVAPKQDGELDIDIPYAQHGLAPGATVDGISGTWRQLGHVWGGAGRPSGGAFTLPAFLPPPVASASHFAARATALGVRRATGTQTAEVAPAEPKASAPDKTAAKAPARKPAAAKAAVARARAVAPSITPVSSTAAPTGAVSTTNAQLAAFARLRASAGRR